VAEYLKIPEVADLLELSEQTIRRRVKSGDIPSVFVGGVYRIPRTELKEYLEQVRVRPGEAARPKADAAEGGPGEITLNVDVEGGRYHPTDRDILALDRFLTKIGRRIKSGDLTLGEVDIALDAIWGFGPVAVNVPGNDLYRRFMRTAHALLDQGKALKVREAELAEAQEGVRRLDELRAQRRAS
jgi:excisionase family DNA binding protein